MKRLTNIERISFLQKVCVALVILAILLSCRIVFAQDKPEGQQIYTEKQAQLCWEARYQDLPDCKNELNKMEARLNSCEGKLNQSKRELQSCQLNLEESNKKQGASDLRLKLFTAGGLVVGVGATTAAFMLFNLGD